MDGLVIFLVVMAVVVGALWYLFKNRRGAAARGIGAAGSRYNEFYGFGDSQGSTCQPTPGDGPTEDPPRA